MNRHLLDGRQKKNPLKRVLASSKREVVFDAPRKKSRLLLSLSLALVLILTSRPNLAPVQKTPAIDRKVSPAKFYESKSVLEKQYERRLKRFLPSEESSDFLPLSEAEAPENGTNEVETDVNEPVEVIAEPEEEEAVVELPIITPENIEEYTSSADFSISWLIHTSEDFIRQAHTSVLDANDIQGTKTYFKLIKLALKALHMLITKYRTSLNPALELVVYYELAHIYFSETENLEMADTYINKAIALSSRHNLVRSRIICEFLCSQILQTSNPNLVASYLVEKQTSYSNQGLHNISDLFALARVNNLLVTDAQTGLTTLQSICQRPGVHPIVRILSLLYQTSLNLYQGNPEDGALCISEVEKLLTPDHPPQLRAMCHLLKFAYYISANKAEKGKPYLEILSSFISLQRLGNWKGWQEDGAFETTVPIINDGEEEVPFRVLWLSSDEFVIMFYFLSGVLFLTTGASHKRTNKVFSTCLDIIGLQIEELTKAKQSTRNFPIAELTGKIVRLNYVRFSIHFYRVWLNFIVADDFTGVAFLQGFIKSFDEDNFTKEELCYYRPLIPRILYLTAIYFQAHGDLKAAKYYFARVKHMSSSSQSLSGPEISFLQKGLGIGCESSLAKDHYSELYMFSTLHLLLITEYEMRLAGKQQLKETTQLRISLGTLYADLTLAAEEKTSSKTFVGSNVLFLLSFKSAECVFSNKGFVSMSKESTLVPQIIELLDKVSDKPYIAVLATYILFRLSVNLEQSNDYFAQCLRMVSENDNNSRILSIFVLSEAQRKEIENMDPAKAELLGLRIEGLRQRVASIFELAHTSEPST